MRGPANWLSIVGLLACSGGCDSPLLARSTLGAAQSSLLSVRFTSGRLEGQAWRACQRSDADSTEQLTVCTSGGETDTLALARVAATAAAVNSALAKDTSVANLRASSLVDLRASTTAKPALARAIASLERARSAAPADASLLNDLSVAYLELGEREQQLTPLLRALDAVEVALHRDSLLVSALFNRALILQRLHLVATADSAWAKYLAVERDNDWRAEASGYRQRLSRIADTLTARQYPQQSRDAVFRLLGEWGAAIGRGDDLTAGRLFDTAAAIGDSLRRLGADGSVELAVHWLDHTRRDPRRAMRAAQALQGFASGIHSHDNAAYEDAERTLAEAEASLRALGSPTARWAAFYRAAAEVNLGRYELADARLRAVVREATAREPALVGKALWVRGVREVRLGNYEAGNTLYAEARGYFARAKDVKNEAAVTYLLSEGLSLAGLSSVSVVEGYRALLDLAPFRQSYYLHNHLIAVAAFARGDGLRYASLDLVGEALVVNQALGKNDALVFALNTHARDLASVGDTAHAVRDLDAAARAANRLTGHSRERALVDIDVARARLMRGSDVRTATVLLARAVQGYRDLGVKTRVPAALYESAVAARDAGDKVAARSHLSEAIDLIEGQRASFSSTEARSAFYETVESVFDAMIAMELDAGRSDSAFSYLERERISVLPLDGADRAATRQGRVAPSLADIGRALPSDVLFVTYAVLPDRIAIWSATQRGTAERSVSIPRDSLARLIARFTRESRRAVTRPADARAALFTLLLGPVAGELAAARQLAVVPDRELVDLPFATLWNPASQRFVLEDHSVRTEPSGAFMLAAADLLRGSPRKSSAFVVGDPLLSHTEPTALEPLPGANREARQVAELYARSQLLSGASARRGSVVASLPQYSIFHFAGHAVFNSDRPEMSYLALSADENGAPGRLEAREIATLKLSNLRLVVLSACSTMRSRPSRTGAVVGLAYSFLRAGVPATVSTLWDVSDDAIGEILVDFHRHVERGVSPHEALRLAQLAALTSPRVSVRSPVVWGALVYTGP